MKTIDQYMTRQAQAVWPGATVWETPRNGRPSFFHLERLGEPDVGLGFGSAARGLAALIAAHRQREKNANG